MPKKVKVVDVVVEAADNSDLSYEAVKDEVVESVPEVTTVSASEPCDAQVVEPQTDEGFKPVKTKKSAEIVTCEYCGKSMTAKSLKYTHCIICPKRPGIETINCVGDVDVNDVPEQAPPKPKLQRSVTVVESHDEPVKPKAKAKPRAKKTVAVEEAETPTLPEPSKRRSRGVERVMKYESMVANAL